MAQAKLGRGSKTKAFSTSVDIVFAIDATGSMQPLIDKVKSITTTFHQELTRRLEAKSRHITSLRVKVIVFRDYYVDYKLAMEESEFFELPEENNAFKEFVSGIRAAGGGDEPENSLEAIALAMRSDFLRDAEKQRHIIVLFTDASAHPFEKAKKGKPDNYPDNMFGSMQEFTAAWGKEQSQGKLNGGSNRAGGGVMSKQAKRLVLFAPRTSPWTDFENGLDNVVLEELNRNNGGRDLNLEAVYAQLVNSV